MSHAHHTTVRGLTARRQAAAAKTVSRAQSALTDPTLPPRMREVALLRLRHPADSVADLAGRAGTTRAAMANLLRRLANHVPETLASPASPVVPVGKARSWLRRLRRYYTTAELAGRTGLGEAIINRIDSGRTDRILPDTEQRILAVSPGTRMPQFEYIPKAQRPRLRCLGSRPRRWRPAPWDWVLVDRAVTGRISKGELNAVELERAVRTMTARGLSDSTIDQLLRWSAGDGAAVTAYRANWHIPPGRPEFSHPAPALPNAA